MTSEVNAHVPRGVVVDRPQTGHRVTFVRQGRPVCIVWSVGEPPPAATHRVADVSAEGGRGWSCGDDVAAGSLRVISWMTGGDSGSCRRAGVRTCLVDLLATACGAMVRHGRAPRVGSTSIIDP